MLTTSCDANTEIDRCKNLRQVWPYIAGSQACSAQHIWVYNESTILGSAANAKSGAAQLQAFATA